MSKEEMMEIYANATEPMVFVRRVAGVIKCAWLNYQEDATEILAESHPDVITFRSGF
jgi:hypothetical protein